MHLWAIKSGYPFQAPPCYQFSPFPFQPRPRLVGARAPHQVLLGRRLRGLRAALLRGEDDATEIDLTLKFLYKIY